MRSAEVTVRCDLVAILFSRCSSVVCASALCLCRKGQQLEPSEQYIFNRLEGGRSMLTIRNIRQGDGGTYTCKATNKAGSQERELFLKVFGKDVDSHLKVKQSKQEVSGQYSWYSKYVVS